MKDDVISRAELLKQSDYLEDEHTRHVVKGLATMLPSAQPTHGNTSNALKSLDCIDRQAAIDRAVSIPMFGRDVKMVAVSEIKNLPSAQPEQRWIPVSERLPNGFQTCIVTDELRQCSYEYDYNPDNEFTKRYGWRYNGRKIIAWMPLPEPWKEGEADE